MSSLAKNYKRRNLSFSKGKGSYLYTKRGIKFLDFVQGIAVNSLGHAHPQLVKAINQQSKKLWHVSNAFVIPEGEVLAKKLAEKTFADYIMFVSAQVKIQVHAKACNKDNHYVKQGFITVTLSYVKQNLAYYFNKIYFLNVTLL